MEMGSINEMMLFCWKFKLILVLIVVFVREKCREILLIFLNQVYEEEFILRRDVGGFVLFRDVWL